MAGPTYLESLKGGLLQAMIACETVIVIGEDILDPYGGAFKVTQGLSTRFPGRIIGTPISESAIVGVATGMALRGFRPVAEIMFGDFITLCTDQLVNGATKFPLMYPGITVPIVVRTPMGGGRGYGPTHSQSLEKMFLGVPGLKVVAPSLAHDPGRLLEQVILRESDPTLFVEFKTLYSRRLLSDSGGFFMRSIGAKEYPTALVNNFDTGQPDAVIIGYGGVSEPLVACMTSLISEEIRIRAILPSLLNELSQIEEWVELIPEGTPIIIAETGTAGFGWTSEVSARLNDLLFGTLKRPIMRLAAANGVIPAARRLEQDALLSERTITEAVLSVCGL